MSAVPRDIGDVLQKRRQRLRSWMTQTPFRSSAKPIDIKNVEPSGETACGFRGRTDLLNPRDWREPRSCAMDTEPSRHYGSATRLSRPRRP